MKKLVLLMSMLLVSVLSFAGSEIKVTEGSTAFLNNGGSASVVFDWSKAMWDNKVSAKERLAGDYDNYVKLGEASFVEGFNSAKKMQMTAGGKSDYNFKVEFTNFDYFFSASSIVPGHKHRVWADITVTDKSGAVVCKFSVVKFKGGRDFVVIDSFKEMMNDLAKTIAVTK